jgi:hypothetical protein
VANVRGDGEDASWEDRAIPARPTAGMGDAFARHMILFTAGVGVLCLSFWITLTIIDTEGQYHASDVRLADVPLTNQDGSPRNGRPSKISDLPNPPVVRPFHLGWDGLQGVNALIMGPGPTGGGNLAVSLVAIHDPGPHRLGLAIAGLPENRPVHAIAWIKAPPGTRINVDVRDGAVSGHAPRNSGTAALELSPPKVLASTGNVHAGVTGGPSDWAKIPIEMPSSNGVCVIYFGLLAPDEQMIFGGIELTAG